MDVLPICLRNLVSSVVKYFVCPFVGVGIAVAMPVLTSTQVITVTLSVSAGPKLIKQKSHWISGDLVANVLWWSVFDFES